MREHRRHIEIIVHLQANQKLANCQIPGQLSAVSAVMARFAMDDLVDSYEGKPKLFGRAVLADVQRLRTPLGQNLAGCTEESSFIFHPL